MTSTSTASTSTTSAASLHQFLAAHRVEKGCEHTHTSLGRPLGSYYVPSSSHGRFLELYKAAVERGDDLFLTERHRHIGPVVVDLDFRYEPLAEELAALAPAPGSSPSTSLGRLPSPIMTMAAETSPSTSEAFKGAGGGGGSRRRHSGVVEAVVRSYCKAMVELVETPAEFDVYVTEKRSASLFKGLVKDGLHLAAPDVVTRPAVQLILRKDVLAALAEVFKPLGLANRVEDVVDEAVIERNNWMMYGSKKPGGEPYAVTRRYRYARGVTAVAEGTLSLVAAGQEASPTHYVELLSIRNKYDELGVREDHRDRVEAYITRVDEDRRRREAVQSVLSQAGPNPRANVCESLEQVQRLVSILDIRRVESYDEWVRLGWCLRNIDHRLLETWVETSKRSPKYVEGECPRLWNAMRAGSLGLGTLHMWARDDAPDKYRELLRLDLVGLIKCSVGGAHYDVACVVHHLYKYEYVCCNIKTRQWYEFRNHRWHECDSGFSLRRRLSTDVYREVGTVAQQIQRRMNSMYEDGEPGVDEDRKRCAEQVKKLMDLQLKLKTTKFKDDVMKECGELFYEERFESKLDSNVDLLGFENGIYDLEQHEFRDGRPDDYVSFSTLINYVPFAGDDHSIVRDINRFWESVHPVKEIRDYVLCTLSSCLSGRIREERFNIWTGSGCHAAGTQIMMLDGSTKNVEDVVIDDVLMGDDSTPRNVLKLHRGRSDMWRVVPVKGEPFVVNGEHTLSFKMSQSVYMRQVKNTTLWEVSYHLFDVTQVIRGNRRRFAEMEAAKAWYDFLMSDKGGAVKSGDVVNVSVKNFMEKVKPYDRRLFNLYRPDFVEFVPQPIDERLHPYVLGVWLGDGTTTWSQITNMDAPIVDRFRELLPKTVKMTTGKHTKGRAETYNVSKADGIGGMEKNDLAKALDSYSLLGDKHIPLAYRCNTKEIRMQVLAGLLDTDGDYQAHCNQLSLTLGCERLFDDALDLARSLGFACYKSKIKKKCCNNGVVGTYFRMQIVGKGIEDIPLQLAYKRPRTRVKAKDVHRVGVRRVERVDDGDYFGFEVDSNHLFVLGSQLVTVNSNGKSLSVSLLEKTLGNYCCKFPVTLLTQKRAVSNAATPEIARAKGRRFAVLQEPSEDERLNVGQLKELSGGDTVQTRELFKAPCEWRPQFKLFLLCNQLPNVPSDDGGTWRRIRVVEFGSKFVESPSPERPNEFPIDMGLSGRVDSWKEHFMAMLIHVYYRKYSARSLEEPAAVMQCTRDYQRTNDHMADFVDSCIERVPPPPFVPGAPPATPPAPPPMLGIDEAFEEFKQWVRADQVPIKVPKKGSVQKYLERALGRGATVRGSYVFRGFRLKDKFPRANEDEL